VHLLHRESCRISFGQTQAVLNPADSEKEEAAFVVQQCLAFDFGDRRMAVPTANLRTATVLQVKECATHLEDDAPLPLGSVGKESHLVPNVTSLSMRGAAFLTLRVDPNQVF